MLINKIKIYNIRFLYQINNKINNKKENKFYKLYMI